MLTTTLRPTAIIMYKRKQKGLQQTTTRAKSLDNLQKKYTNGCLSESAKKMIKKTIANWSVGVLASQRLYSKNRERKRRYFVMITLTLPTAQQESDNKLKRKFLNIWLQRLERVHKGINYLWVAEVQKNGNLHFHIVVDRWVNYLWVSSTWNKTLANGEYINEFEKKFGHRNPPTTKVTGQKKMKDPALYITKYISKAENRRKIEGHCWYCCDNLKKINNLSLLNSEEIENYICEQCPEKLKKVYYGEYSTAYYFIDPLAINGVLNKLLTIDFLQICRYYGIIYPELIELIPEDLPKEIFPEWC
mgnify:CR=1 FL=1